jgi:glucuronosyltransferase
VFQFFFSKISKIQGIIKSEGVQTILEYPDEFKFDLVIYDFIGGPILLPLIQKFNYPPMIGVAAFDNCPFRSNLVGGYQYAAYS